jgi:hypothetical protein
MLSFPVEPAPDVPNLATIKAGALISVPGHEIFLVDDIKTASCVATEGEMPFPAPARQERLSVDASNAKGEFLSVEKIGLTQHVYLGRYLEFNDFKFTQLRQLDGW